MIVSIILTLCVLNAYALVPNMEENFKNLCLNGKLSQKSEIKEIATKKGNQYERLVSSIKELLDKKLDDLTDDPILKDKLRDKLDALIRKVYKDNFDLNSISAKGKIVIEIVKKLTESGDGSCSDLNGSVGGNSKGGLLGGLLKGGALLGGDGLLSGLGLDSLLKVVTDLLDQVLCLVEELLSSLLGALMDMLPDDITCDWSDSSQVEELCGKYASGFAAYLKLVEENLDNVLAALNGKKEVLLQCKDLDDLKKLL